MDGEWEVGLTEISFQFDVDNVLEGEGYFVLHNPEYNDSDFEINLLRDTMVHLKNYR